MIERNLGHHEIFSDLGTGGYRPLRVLAVIAICVASALVAAAQNDPSTSEQTQIIEKARELALEYTANLPNFICTETIRRSQLPKRSQKWKLLDTLAVDVAFSDQGERYRLLTINGKSTRKRLKEIGGMRSD